MKNFLQKNDLFSAIKSDELEVLIESTPNGEQDLADSIEAATIEVASYIRHRYDVDLVFVPVEIYDTSKIYAADVVVILLADPWVAGIYQVGDLVEKDLEIFACQNVTTSGDVPGVSAKWFLLGEKFEVFKSLVAANADFPTEALSWEKIADPRDKLIKRLTIDVTLYELYSRINPRQIPEHRIKKRDDATDYLVRAADPRKNVNLDLPLVNHGENSGNDITFGSNPKQSHNY